MADPHDHEEPEKGRPFDPSGQGVEKHPGEAPSDLRPPRETGFALFPGVEASSRALLESLPDALLLSDLDGRPRYVNPAFTELLGWRLEEVKGRPVPLIPEAEEERYRLMTRDVLHTGRRYRGFETKGCTADGRLLDVSLSAARLEDDRGVPCGYLLTLRDITARKAREAQRLQGERIEAAGALAGSIAHDFNNILQAISGYSQILLAGREPDDPDLQKLDAIEKASRKASELTGKLLDFSWAPQKGHGSVDLNQTVRSVTEHLRASIPESIRLDVQCDGDLVPVEGDAFQFETVLLNLGRNACSAMPEGGTLKIEMRSVNLDKDAGASAWGFEPGAHVRLRVSDTGIGIPEKDLAHIYEPLFTTKKPKAGAGFGLARVYRTVQRQGGSITCRSQPGQGTTFDLLFPALKAQGEEETGERETRGRPNGGKTILLVDDEPVILDVVRDMLAMAGYRTLLAESGEKALEVYDQKGAGVDLVLLDLNMPGMGGQGCLEGLLKRDPSLRVIIATGQSAGSSIRKALACGAADYISKPYSYKDILTKLRGILDGGPGHPQSP